MLNSTDTPEITLETNANNDVIMENGSGIEAEVETESVEVEVTEEVQVELVVGQVSVEKSTGDFQEVDSLDLLKELV